MKAAPEDILFEMVKTDPEMFKAVGDRIFPEVAPESTADGWLVYQRVGGANDANSHSGYDDLSEPVYQLTFWTKDARNRKVVRGHMLQLFRMKRLTIKDTDVVIQKQDDRDLNEDGPPRMYGAQFDISVSL